MGENVLRFEYLPKQGQFFENCDRVIHSAYIGGFGSGKTYALCIQALRAAAHYGAGSLGLIGAPTYKMLSDVTQRTFLRLCPPQWIKVYHKSSNKIILKNGAEILFRSLENEERLAGLTLDWWGLDEVGSVKLDTFRMLQGRMRGNQRCIGFCVGNPAGPTHWTYDYFVVEAQKRPESYALVQAPTLENVFLPKQYTEEMKGSFKEGTPYYRRYVLGEFVAFEGAYWGDFDLRPYPDGLVCTIDDIWNSSILDKSSKWTWGRVIDFGFEHPFVCLWYVCDGRKIIFFDEYYQRHRTMREHGAAIRAKDVEHWEKYAFPIPQHAYTDHDAQARAELEHLELPGVGRAGIFCVPAEKEVMDGILLVQTLILTRRIFVTKNCTQTLREIPSYRAKPIEKCKDEKPLKENDDCCDCVRMACSCELEHVAPWRRAEGARRILGDPEDIKIEELPRPPDPNRIANPDMPYVRIQHGIGAFDKTPTI